MGNLLKFIRFSDLEKWYVEYYLNNITLNSKYEMLPLYNLITPVKRRIKKADYDGLLPVVAKIVFSTGKIFFRAENKTGMDLYKVCAGDILISSINFHQGAVAFNNISDFVCSTHYQTYMPNIKLVVPEFLVMVLRTQKFLEVVNGQKANGIKNESGYDFIGSFKIPVPPIVEQRKILAEYNRLKEKARQLETEAREKLNSFEEYLYRLLGIENVPFVSVKTGTLETLKFSQIVSKWEIDRLHVFLRRSYLKCNYPIKSLGEIVHFVRRGWSQKKCADELFDYIELGGVDADSNIAAAAKLKTTNAPSRASQIVKTGDLILGTTRPNLKKFAIIDNKQDGFVCSSGFQVIERTDSYCNEYILQMLKMPVVIEQFQNFVTGALYPAITNDMLAQVQIPLPPLEMQREIAEHISREKDKIASNIAEAENFKTAAYRYFESAVFE